MEKRFPQFFAIFFFFQKPSLCMSNNVQVDQYHEEAGGQRTVVRLGNNFSSKVFLLSLGVPGVQNNCHFLHIICGSILVTIVSSQNIKI